MQDNEKRFDLLVRSAMENATEEVPSRVWDSIEGRLQYKQWYCGHYHTEKVIDKMTFMFETIRAFPTEADFHE